MNKIKIMKNFLLLISSFLIFSGFNSGEEDKIKNLKTFAKAYGYVKYFHPSKEASNIDWNKFAAYGAEEILKCENSSEVRHTLQRIFKPIAPSIIFSETKQDYDLKSITPPNVEDYEPCYWQHSGVSIGTQDTRNVYKSVRVNGIEIKDNTPSFGNLLMGFDPKEYLGKEIKYTGYAKLKKETKERWTRY
jgi:hypothetical protein